MHLNQRRGQATPKYYKDGMTKICSLQVTGCFGLTVVDEATANQLKWEPTHVARKIKLQLLGLDLIKENICCL